MTYSFFPTHTELTPTEQDILSICYLPTFGIAQLLDLSVRNVERYIYNIGRKFQIPKTTGTFRPRRTHLLRCALQYGYILDTRWLHDERFILTRNAKTGDR